MKIFSIVGARPQFVKAAAVSREVRREHEEFLLHTGQHYDYDLSQSFFDQLRIPAPDLNLEVGSGSHGAQTAAMLTGIEQALERQRPDRILVYGDTNSTLAGALAAAKLSVPVAHVEAGLRSFNRAMPEEVNRVVTDHLADLHFCPSPAAVDNLAAEGVTRGVHLVGDVMADVLEWARDKAERASSAVATELGLAAAGYLLVTVHRAENTDDSGRLGHLLEALSRLEEPVIWPVHPRTRKALARIGRSERSLERGGVRCVEPVGYLEMIRLVRGARLVMTDSGGLQKEAYWLHVPCITLRDESEWVETLDSGWNVLAGADPERILELVRNLRPPEAHPALYGDGTAATQILEVLRRS